MKLMTKIKPFKEVEYMLGISFLRSKKNVFPQKKDIRMLSKLWLKHKYKESTKKEDELMSQTKKDN
jgi:hypothetical protein